MTFCYKSRKPYWWNFYMIDDNNNGLNKKVNQEYENNDKDNKYN